MELRIVHETCYDYAAPVMLAQHMAHLRPSAALIARRAAPSRRASNQRRAVVVSSATDLTLRRRASSSSSDTICWPMPCRCRPGATATGAWPAAPAATAIASDELISVRWWWPMASRLARWPLW